MNNQRFQSYVTSGAFRLALTRQQISTLAMLPSGQMWSNSASDLERKGLCEAVRKERDGDIEYRITSAGALALDLCGMAGLVNVEPGEASREVERLRAALASAYDRSHMLQNALSIMSPKLQQSERELAAATARLKELTQEEFPKVRLRPEFVTLRDLHPDISRAQCVELGKEALNKASFGGDA